MRRIAAMKTAGLWMIALGVVLALIAFMLPNTVETPQTEYLASIGTTITRGTQEVFNLAKGQMQMMMLHAGCALFVGGSVLAAGGEIASYRQIDAGNVEGHMDTAPSTAIDPPTVPAPPPLQPEEVDRRAAQTKRDNLALFGGVGLVLLLLIIFAFMQQRTESEKRNAATAAAMIETEKAGRKLQADLDQLNADMPTDQR